MLCCCGRAIAELLPLESVSIVGGGLFNLLISAACCMSLAIGDGDSVGALLRSIHSTALVSFSTSASGSSISTFISSTAFLALDASFAAACAATRLSLPCFW